jgi:hypothetical protein
MKCSICGRDFKREVNKNMHEKFCKGTKKNATKSPEASSKKKSETSETIEQCNHEFILLNKNVPSEKRAINSGYSAVCLKCKDLV